MLFASSGFHVALYDVINENVDKALVDISQQLNNLESKGLLRGDINAKQQFALIQKVSTLQECLNGAIHVQVKYFIY
jgi:L-gulonate 3-dehydrogenase